MNVISMLQAEEVTVELKYCERCGGLWLRPRGDPEVYCASCRLRMTELPRLPAALIPARRRERRRCGTVPLRLESLQGIAELEVRP